MVHDEDEGTSVQLSALLPAMGRPHQPPQVDHASVSGPEDKPAAGPSYQPLQSENARASGLEDSTKGPSGSRPRETPVPQQDGDIELEAFYEPVSPAVDMELLTDDEVGGGQLDTQSRPNGSSLGHSGHLHSERGSGRGSGGGAGPPGCGVPGDAGPPPPPPLPPGSPPPPPPAPVEAPSQAVDERCVEERGSQKLRGVGGLQTAAAEPRKLQQLNAGRTDHGKLPISRHPPAAEPPPYRGAAKASASHAAAPSPGQQRSSATAQHRGAQRQELRSPIGAAAPAPSKGLTPPVQVQHNSGQMHSGRGRQGLPVRDRSVPSGSVNNDSRMLMRAPETAPSQQMHSIRQQQLRQDNSTQHHVQQQQSGKCVPAATGVLGSMLQSIMDNVHTVGAAVLQTGGPSLPPVRLGPPPQQAHPTSEQPGGLGAALGMHQHPQQSLGGPAPLYSSPMAPSVHLQASYQQPPPVWEHPATRPFQQQATSRHPIAEQSQPQQPQPLYHSHRGGILPAQAAHVQGAPEAAWHPQAQQVFMQPPMHSSSFPEGQGLLASLHADVSRHAPADSHHAPQLLPPVRHPWDVQAAPHPQQIVHHPPAVVTQQNGHPWG